MNTIIIPAEIVLNAIFITAVLTAGLIEWWINGS